MVAKVTVSNTDTTNKITVTDGSAISVLTAGTQGLAGPNTILSKSVTALTLAASNGGAITISLPIGISFKLGIGFNVTDGGNDGNTGATVANEVFGSIFWK